MFCSICGSKVEAGQNFCGQCGVSLAAGDSAPGTAGAPSSGKEQILRDLEKELSLFSMLAVARSDKTDLEIKSVLADANWGAGKKKVEYSGCLLVREADRTVVYWEMIKETGAGMGVFGRFRAETYKSDGRTISGRVREAGYGPGGKIIDYDWDYGRTRGIVEGVVKSRGWKFTTVLFKKKAMY